MTPIRRRRTTAAICSRRRRLPIRRLPGLGAARRRPQHQNAPASRYYRDAGAPSQNAVMRDVLPVPVEKGDLAPVMSTDGSGLPYELWRGVDVPALEKLIASIEIPPRSPALHGLWKRLITSTTGDASNAAFTALRLEALYRSGLARAAAAEIAKQRPPAQIRSS